MFPPETGLETSVQDFVARALSEVEEAGTLGVLVVPVPAAPLSAFLRTMPRGMSVLWDTVGRLTIAAAGVVDRFDVQGAPRFDQLRHWLEKSFSRIKVFAHPDAPVYVPRCFGGIAFHPRVAAEKSGDGVWNEFGDGSFTLPRWCYGRRGDRGFLALTVDGLRDRGLVRHEELLRQLDEICETIEGSPGRSVQMPAVAHAQDTSIQATELRDWEAYVAKIHALIEGGQFQKIVAARRTDVLMGRPIDDLEVLGGLLAESNCTRFAFRRAHSSFVGASPETLFHKIGNRVETEALAGTMRSLGSEWPTLSRRTSELLASKKNASEHELVVDDIYRALAPLCRKISDIPAPSVRKIRNILHVNTPIEAELREGVHAVELLAALHPTPAVGGMPKQEAAAWVANNELCERGWYTGALGWFDAAGDARFVVAIRCGLLAGPKAHIFSGAGIVRDSDAAAEFAETDLKQLPLLRALGLAT